MALTPKLFIELASGQTVTMKGKLSFIREVAMIDNLGWKIQGDVLQHNYTITKNGQKIAPVHQKWLAWGDTYEISISEGVDEVLVLSVVLCFDIIHAERSSSAVTTGTQPSSSNNA